MYARPDLILQTPVTLRHHLQSLIAKDLEAILNDYSEQAVLFTPNGVFNGREQIRGFYQYVIEQLLTPEFLRDFRVELQEIRGECAYIIWSSGATIPLGTDTFLVREGKIVMQTFAAYQPQVS